MFEKYLNTINDFFSTGQAFIWSYFAIGLLVVLGIYFTISFKFIQFKGIKEMFRVLTESPDREGVSSFQAFTISAASRVGTGNIVGVAIAISMGGPGAVFWMWVMAGLGASSAFIEATLAQIYKKRDPETGAFIGGPAYYIERGLNQKWLSVIFAVLITITFAISYSSIQANTIAQSLEIYHVPTHIIGIVLAILTAVIIFGGVHRIAKFTEWFVPLLAIVYLAMALLVIIMNITHVPHVMMMIIKGAFGIEQFAGGSIGAATAMFLGIKRGLFSNEAGEGSAPHAAATASVSHPVKQGLIQALGVYFDTWIVCSATAFMILLYPGLEYGESALSGIKLTQTALIHHLGTIGGSLLTFSVFLLAYSTIIGNYFYGETNIKYLTDSKIALQAFRVLAVLVIYFGSVVQLDLVWNIGDFFMALITTINLIAILSLSHVVYSTTVDYLKQRKAGKNPIFEIKNISSDLTNIDCWGENNAK